MIHTQIMAFPIVATWRKNHRHAKIFLDTYVLITVCQRCSCAAEKGRPAMEKPETAPGHHYTKTTTRCHVTTAPAREVLHEAAKRAKYCSPRHCARRGIPAVVRFPRKVERALCPAREKNASDWPRVQKRD